VIRAWWLLALWAADGVVQVSGLTQPWDDALLRVFYAFEADPIVRKDAPVTPHDGVGVWLRDDLLVTAGHVVRGGTSMRARAGGQEVSLSVADVDVDQDVAWLRPVSGALVPSPRPLSHATAVQLPDGAWGHITASSPRAVTGAARVFLQTDLLVKPGLSGSPLLDADGAVAGLVVGGLRTQGSDEGPAIAAPPSSLVPRARTAAVAEQALSVGAAPDLTWRGLPLRFVDGAVEVASVPERWARFGWLPGMRLARAGGSAVAESEARALLEGLTGAVIVEVAGVGPLVAPG